MSFYYLHDNMIKPTSIKECKYIYYQYSGLGTFTNKITFTNEPDITYCPHKMDSNKIIFDPLDDNIDVLSHDGVIIAKFIKIANNDKFETWINEDFIEK